MFYFVSPSQHRTSAATSTGLCSFYFGSFWFNQKIISWLSVNIVSLCHKLRPTVPLSHSNAHRLQCYLGNLRLRPGKKQTVTTRISFPEKLYCYYICTSLSTNSWRTSPSTSWCPSWGVIFPETAATPSCCGRCCWRSSPTSWILLWTSWPPWLVSLWRTQQFQSNVPINRSHPQPNATIGSSVSEILDVMGEIRVSLLSDEQLRNSSVVQTWFFRRLRLFLPSASGRFLSCLSSRNLSCHSYQMMWVTEDKWHQFVFVASDKVLLSASWKCTCFFLRSHFNFHIIFSVFYYEPNENVSRKRSQMSSQIK